MESKKQNEVARSSAEAKYQGMVVAASELIWIKQLLKKLKFGENKAMELVWDNDAALHIGLNSVFYDRTN